MLTDHSPVKAIAKARVEGKSRDKRTAKGTGQGNSKRKRQGKSTSGRCRVRERARIALVLDFSVGSVRDHTIHLRVPNITSSQVPSRTHKVIARSLTRTGSVKNNTATVTLFTLLLPVLFFFLGVSAASLRSKVILDSGVTYNMGASDQLAHVQHEFWQHGISPNAPSAKPLNFTFVSRSSCTS